MGEPGPSGKPPRRSQWPPVTTLSLQLLGVGLREFQKEVLHSRALLLLLPSPSFIHAAYSQPLSIWTENIFSPFSVLYLIFVVLVIGTTVVV